MPWGPSRNGRLACSGTGAYAASPYAGARRRPPGTEPLSCRWAATRLSRHRRPSRKESTPSPTATTTGASVGGAGGAYELLVATEILYYGPWCGFSRRLPVSPRWPCCSPSAGLTGFRFFATTRNVLISGTVFNDANNDARKNSGEAGLLNWRVYIDADNDGRFDSGEKSVLTDSSGNYRFTSLAAGTHRVRIVQQPAWTRTTPPAASTPSPSQRARSRPTNTSGSGGASGPSRLV